MKTWIPDSRKFAYLNWKQVAALPKQETLLVLPTAAIEQHGHHLPLATDTLIGNLLLGKALRNCLLADAPVYALNRCATVKATEHLGDFREPCRYRRRRSWRWCAMSAPAWRLRGSGN